MKRTLAILAAACMLTVAFPVLADGHEPDLADREDFIVEGSLVASPHTAATTTWAATGGVVNSLDTFQFVLGADKEETEARVGIDRAGPGLATVAPGDLIGTVTDLTTTNEAISLADEFLYAVDIYFWGVDDDDNAYYLGGTACFGDPDPRACKIPEEAKIVEMAATHSGELDVIVGHAEPVIVFDPDKHVTSCSDDPKEHLWKSHSSDLLVGSIKDNERIPVDVPGNAAWLNATITWDGEDLLQVTVFNPTGDALGDPLPADPDQPLDLSILSPEEGTWEVALEADSMDNGTYTVDTEVPWTEFLDGVECTLDASQSYDTIGEIETFEWFIDQPDDGFPPNPNGTGPIAELEFEDWGTHTVKLTATDDAGVQATETFDVTVTE